MRSGPFMLLPARLAISGFTGIDQWEKHAKSVFDIANWSYWWLGDMAVFGQAQFGDDWLQAVPEGTSSDKVSYCEHVVRKYPAEVRIPSLGFSHHKMALKIANPVLRKTILKRAADMRLTEEEFQQYLESI